MNGSHTSGDWQVSKHGTPDHSPQYGIYVEGEPNDFCIVKGPNAKADAELIAAAPELLKAARAALADKQARFGMTPDNYPVREVLARAIAKATGNS